MALSLWKWQNLFASVTVEDFVWDKLKFWVNLNSSVFNAGYWSLWIFRKNGYFLKSFVLINITKKSCLTCICCHSLSFLLKSSGMSFTISSVVCNTILEKVWQIKYKTIYSLITGVAIMPSHAFTFLRNFKESFGFLPWRGPRKIYT